MNRFLTAVLFILAGAAAAEEPGAVPAQNTGDVAYWTTSYAGEDLISGKFECKPPAIPAYSKTNNEIDAMTKAIAAWEACYNGFVDNLNANPPGQRIPAEVRAKMSAAQAEQASRHLDEVYAKVMDRAEASAAATIARRDAWRAETGKYVEQQNKEMAMRNEAKKRELEMDLRRTQEMRSNVTGARATAGQ